MEKLLSLSCSLYVRHVWVLRVWASFSSYTLNLDQSTWTSSLQSPVSLWHTKAVRCYLYGIIDFGPIKIISFTTESQLYIVLLVYSSCTCAIQDIVHWNQVCILDFEWEAIGLLYTRANLTDIMIMNSFIYIHSRRPWTMGFLVEASPAVVLDRNWRSHHRQRHLVLQTLAQKCLQH